MIVGEPARHVSGWIVDVLEEGEDGGVTANIARKCELANLKCTFLKIVD